MQNVVVYACFYAEKGLFNDSYLSIGTAIRKALSAGLHKTSSGIESTGQSNLIWRLYHFEKYLLSDDNTIFNRA